MGASAHPADDEEILIFLAPNLEEIIFLPAKGTDGFFGDSQAEGRSFLPRPLVADKGPQFPESHEFQLEHSGHNVPPEAALSSLRTRKRGRGEKR